MPKMILHPHYKRTLTEINAIVTVVDYIRSTSGVVHGPIDTAMKVLEKRLTVLRRRRDHNRQQRKNKKTGTSGGLIQWTEHAPSWDNHGTL